MTRRELVAFEGLDAVHKDAVRHVYESSFPLALRAPWEEIEAHRPDERLLVVLDDDSPGDPPVGLVLFRHLGDTPMTFLRYFVVDGQRRGLGHGSALYSELATHLRAAGRSVLLLDVEDPDARPEGSEDRRHDVRRIEFYQRLGVHLLPVADYAPPDHGQGGEQSALLLMGTTLTDAGLTELTLRDAVVAVYQYRYGLAPENPVVRRTLRASGLSAGGET